MTQQFLRHVTYIRIAYDVIQWKTQSTMISAIWGFSAPDTMREEERKKRKCTIFGSGLCPFKRKCPCRVDKVRVAGNIRLRS